MGKVRKIDLVSALALCDGSVLSHDRDLVMDHFQGVDIQGIINEGNESIK